MIPLFRDYPQLARKLPYSPLGVFPTPVEGLKLGSELATERLYIKRDDVSGLLYGGNKVRKLEFLLAGALRAGAKEVLTFGFAGSNHALATSLYARELGLGSVSMLLPQLNAPYVRGNLLMGQCYGAQCHHHGSVMALVLGTFYQLLRHAVKTGSFPHLIAAGGSSTLGVAGYVNAALELRDQILEGQVPEPDLIYLPSGSMGTAAGLMLGLRAAGLKTRVVSVRVVEKRYSSVSGMLRLLRKTNALLHALDPTFPKVVFSQNEVDLRHGFFGGRYALLTEAARKALRRARAEGLELDGTYTAKALAALMSDVQERVLDGKVVLFWHTANSRDFSEVIAAADYHLLPRGFHRYFTPLERGERGATLGHMSGGADA
jgi:D-cysteine desulfhydrase